MALRAKKEALQLAEVLIEEEHAKLARDAEREQIKRRIDNAKAQHDAAKEAHVKASVDKARAKEAVEAHRHSLDHIDRDYQQLKGRVMDAESKVQNLEALSTSGKGESALYGQAMPKVLRAVDTANWKGTRPVGPLGMYVRLKDNRWADALRLGIGTLLGGFAATDYQDRAMLRKILDDNGL